MVARDPNRPSPNELEEKDLADLFRRAQLAAFVGPYRRIYGKQRSVVLAANGSQLASQNATKAEVLFVTVSSITAAVVVSANHSQQSNVLTVSTTLSPNIGGLQPNTMDFILFPGDALYLTVPVPSGLIINEQRF